MVSVRCILCGTVNEYGSPSLEGVTCSESCAIQVRSSVALDTPKDGGKAAFRRRVNERLQWSCKRYYYGLIEEMGQDHARS